MPKTKQQPSQDTTRKAVLEAVLAHVPFDGWTEAAFEAGLKQAKVSPAAADKLFPASLRDVVEAFGEAADDAMQAAIEKERAFARLRVRDKITFAVRARLEYLTPHREAMRRLMTWYAMPLRLPSGLKRISKTVDIIWRAAGDNATDYNYYTKRILLAAVLKATILFWLDDESAGCSASWAFLDRRIGEVMKLGKSISLLKEFNASEIGDFIRRKMKRG